MIREITDTAWLVAELDARRFGQGHVEFEGVNTIEIEARLSQLDLANTLARFNEFCRTTREEISQSGTRSSVKA